MQTLRCIRICLLVCGVFLVAASMGSQWNTIWMVPELPPDDASAFQRQQGYEERSEQPPPIEHTGNTTATKTDEIHIDGTPGSEYAYAFLLAGCDPSFASYRGFLYNMLVTMHILQESGSTADLIVMIRMASNSSHTVLAAEEERWLTSFGAKLVYLPRAEGGTAKESFSKAQMLKFHVLQLTQYRRVLYMDSDIMPLCNLDYWFDLTGGKQPILQQNVVMAWTKEPSNGGWFILSPKAGDFEHVQRIIHEKEKRGASLPYPHFDLEQGWGHSLQNNTWVSFEKKKSGNQWDFYAAHSDQGLLYYWTKFVKKDVSIVIGYDIENWSRSRGSDDEAQHVRTLAHPTKNLTCLPYVEKKKRGFARHPAYGARYMNLQPHGEMIHFYGPFKPWSGDAELETPSKWEAKSGRQYWFHILRILNQRLAIGLDFESWNDLASTQLRTPPLGHGRLIGNDHYS